MDLLPGEESDTLPERLPILRQLRIDCPGLLDQLKIKLLMGLDGESIVVLLGKSQAGPAHFSYFIPIL